MTLRPHKGKTTSPSSDLFTEEGASVVFDRALGQPGAGRAHLLEAFRECLQQLAKEKAGQDGVRDICKAAALSAARSHGNIIETGRILLGGIDEMGGAMGLDLRRCKEDALLGLAEGACQVGPIVYGRFLDIANEYRDNADEWILKNRRRPVVFEPSLLPVIVPFEEELTLRPKTVGSTSTAAAAPAEWAEPPAPVELPTVQASPAPTTPLVGQAETDTSEPKSPPEAAVQEWSRPKNKGFFRRLSEVMGGLFGRRG